MAHPAGELSAIRISLFLLDNFVMMLSNASHSLLDFTFFFNFCKSAMISSLNSNCILLPGLFNEDAISFLNFLSKSISLPSWLSKSSFLNEFSEESK